MSTPRALNRAAIILAAFGLLLVFGLAALIGAELTSSRDLAQARLQQVLEAQAHLAEAALLERVRKIDTALIFLRDSFESHDAEEYKLALARLGKSGLLDIASTNLVTDRNGMVLLSAGKAPETQVSLADRDYFVRLAGSQDRLVISGLVTGRISGRTILVFARRLRDREGGFAGVIAIGIDPQALIGTGLFRQASGSEILTIMSDEGIVLARSSEPEIFTGKRIDDDALATMRSADAVYAVRPSPTDGRLRAHALRRVEDLPLYLAVGDTLDDVEQQVASRRHTLLLSGTTIALLLLTMLWMAWRYAQRRTRQVRELAALKTQLELAQDVAGVGSWLWDIAGERMLASRQVYALMGVEPGQIAPRALNPSSPSRPRASMRRYWRRSASCSSRDAANTSTISGVRTASCACSCRAPVSPSVTPTDGPEP